jgi:hypothetical protein
MLAARGFAAVVSRDKPWERVAGVGNEVDNSIEADVRRGDLARPRV